MKYPPHTSTRFDAELSAVCTRMQEMGVIASNQFRQSIDSLTTHDLMTMDRVIDEGHIVNALEVEINELCIDILIRRQPTANDLRLVSAVIKTVNDLERIGDEAENIAHMSRTLAQKTNLQLPRQLQIEYLASIAFGMLGGAMAAFDAMDSDSARKIGHKDTLVDEEFRSILRHLVAYMMEDTSELSTTLQVAFIIRAIERIANHAKNISEYVVYMLEGRDVRNYTAE